MNAHDLVAAMRDGMEQEEEMDDLNDYLVDTITDAIVILENTLDVVLKAVDEDERELL